MEWSEQVPSLDRDVMVSVAEDLDQLTKPRGSLGRLEELVIRLAGMTGHKRPVFPDKRVVIMAGDHGIVEEGVSAYPQEVTAQMVRNFLAGGAAINAFARQVGGRVVCVDVGIATDLTLPGLIHHKVAYGTRNFLYERAMTMEEMHDAILAGFDVAAFLYEEGVSLIAAGEMGIGNTTVSSAVLSALTGHPVRELTGYGTGIPHERLQKKEKRIEEALLIHHPDPKDPFDVLQKVGGLEIAALAGLMIGAARYRIPIIMDGLISTTAALIAVRIAPSVRAYLLPSHVSEEPGHRIALQVLGLQAPLNLQMRLGEGTGAVLLFPLIDVATRMLREMATFSSANLSTEKRDVD